MDRRLLTDKAHSPTTPSRSGRCLKRMSDHLSPDHGPSRQHGNRGAGEHIVRPLPSKPNSPLEETKYLIRPVPSNWTTLNLYRALASQGDIIRIELVDKTTTGCKDAYVTFATAARSELAIRQLCWEWARTRYAPQVAMTPARLRNQPSPRNPAITFSEKLQLRADVLEIGIMKDEQTMLVLHSTAEDGLSPVSVHLDLRYRYLEVHFAVFLPTTSSMTRGDFRVRMSFPQMTSIWRSWSRCGRCTLTIRMDAPPVVLGKQSNVESTHEPGMVLWFEEQTLIRQVRLAAQHKLANDNRPTKLREDDCVVDIGRCLTYRLEFNAETTMSSQLQEMCRALGDFSVRINDAVQVITQPGSKESVWDGLDGSRIWATFGTPPDFSAMSDLNEIGQPLAYLAFEVRYQLESCLSHGVIHESNITGNFIRVLASMPPEDARRLLEVALARLDENRKNCYYRCEDILELLPNIPVRKSLAPRHCTTIRSAIVTPTTIYLFPPVPETSNRVIRHFQQYEDRFLRVKFTDERYRGKIFTRDGSVLDNVFSRIKRTMKNGIKIGDRTFEFLAFGSSQFREGGAYFFASTPSLSVQDIRDWMGNFSNIKVVAKYCARLGQSFTTTRAMQVAVKIHAIPDIERNGFNFTDGVGKISVFLAQMIAQEFGLPSAISDYPSVFQFRLGGCKGVLAVDQSLSPSTVLIRPSQEKFSAMQHQGLEICRISQYAPANLNVQLILVLATLGVPDHYFTQKLDQMLQKLALAMQNKDMALDLLRKNTDHNKVTKKMMAMIHAGFMERQEPFFVSCLRLWRAWSIKYLREKARIFIEDGAFLLGCIDETATLRGYFTPKKGEETSRITEVPEIFVQVPDRTQIGVWKVITGPCLVARNPSLHPGDVRVVKAVDVPGLRHLRNCVVFPQTGDRDVPSMLSGGDLDGDDYLVIWDKDILPKNWHEEPMNYTAPEPVPCDGPVTVDAIIDFFVTHMRHDNLARIAVAHRYWADFSDQGVKDPRCIELAALHSCAVDFQKTGIPAIFPNHLRPKNWPHWSEVKGKSTYTSKTVLGKLYDAVKPSQFVPAWDLPFDQRILTAHKPDEATLSAAREAKQDYDRAVRQVMGKYGILSEFEVWSAFVLQHSSTLGDYKLSETIGEAVAALKEHQQNACYERAGTNRVERDRSKLDPFLVALYQVTYDELQGVLEIEEGQWVEEQEEDDVGAPTGKRHFEDMPFISCPWIFVEELTQIATGAAKSDTIVPLHTSPTAAVTHTRVEKSHKSSGLEDADKPSLPAVKTDEGTVHAGQLLDLFHKDDDETDHARTDAEPVEYSENQKLLAGLMLPYRPAPAFRKPSVGTDGFRDSTNKLTRGESTSPSASDATSGKWFNESET